MHVQRAQTRCVYFIRLDELAAAADADAAAVAAAAAAAAAPLAATVLFGFVLFFFFSFSPFRRLGVGHCLVSVLLLFLSSLLSLL